uniref:Uncharacterized protein n=1 Tax=Faxonius propinquus nudivirus TaxID=3139431 RepID=A0AAU8GE18_9VIRU
MEMSLNSTAIMNEDIRTANNADSRGIKLWKNMNFKKWLFINANNSISNKTCKLFQIPSKDLKLWKHYMPNFPFFPKNCCNYWDILDFKFISNKIDRIYHADVDNNMKCCILGRMIFRKDSLYFHFNANYKEKYLMLTKNILDYYSYISNKVIHPSTNLLQNIFDIIYFDGLCNFEVENNSQLPIYMNDDKFQNDVSSITKNNFKVLDILYKNYNEKNDEFEMSTNHIEKMNDIHQHPEKNYDEENKIILHKLKENSDYSKWEKKNRIHGCYVCAMSLMLEDDTGLELLSNTSTSDDDSVKFLNYLIPDNFEYSTDKICKMHTIEDMLRKTMNDI